MFGSMSKHFPERQGRIRASQAEGRVYTKTVTCDNTVYGGNYSQGEV